MSLQEKFEALAEGGFHGIPRESFEKGGREQFTYLVNAGLNPDSKVVDLGCGVLRAGYWLIHFLNPGCYHGIEPRQERVQLAMSKILEAEILEHKRPRFDANDQFDTSVFGARFDFFLAYSIWTHASKRQIEVMLDAFLRDSREGATFLATYLPTSWRHGDYGGDKWVGTGCGSDVPGCIHHRFEWIQSACEKRNLKVVRLKRDRTHGQCWLQLSWKLSAH